MLVMTSTILTAAARAKAEDSTGTDPGPYAYRLHRDSCPRIKSVDSPREIDDRIPQYASEIVAAKVCTRCSPSGAVVGAAQAKAQASLEQAAAQEAEAQAEPQPRKERKPRTNAKIGYSIPQGDTMRCLGGTHDEGGEDLPVKKFPTVTGVPGARANECRACRDARRGA